MELLTQRLPSGYHYDFASIRIMPMTFAQILEYLENVPDQKKNPIEHYYFDYCLIKDDDPNIDNLLLIDMEYVIYMKKAITISENLEYDSECTCPRCGEKLTYHVSLAGIQWNHLDNEALNGFNVKFSNTMQPVRMPTVKEFMAIFRKYRAYKKVSDMRIIRLISLFEASQVYLQKVENDIINAKYKDIAVLFMLDSVFFNFVKPLQLKCQKCIDIYQPTDAEIFDCKRANNLDDDEDIPDYLLNDIKSNHGGVNIGMETLVSNFFRDISTNNRLTAEEVLPREVRKDAEH